MTNYQSFESPKSRPTVRRAGAIGISRKRRTIPAAFCGTAFWREKGHDELASKRMRALYQAKGYSDDWIEKRMRSIAIGDELTDEWKKRGVKEQREYAILHPRLSSPLHPPSSILAFLPTPL
jgi:hypothetical protein